MPFFAVKDEYLDYLHDESRKTGESDSIAFPADTRELKSALNGLASFMLQGARTGLFGLAVPNNTPIVNLSKMNRVTAFRRDEGAYYISAQAGCTLGCIYDFLRNPDSAGLLKKEIELAGGLSGTNLFFPPAPSESSATVGGIIAAKASGILAGYGSLSEYLSGIKKIRAGNTEIITEVTLKLLPMPEYMWGICFFFAGAQESLEFIGRLSRAGLLQEDCVKAVEYMDEKTLGFLSASRENAARLKSLPRLPECAGAVYIELHSADERAAESAAERLLGLYDGLGDPDGTWAVSGQSETLKLRELRHYAQEAVNGEIDNIRRGDSSVFLVGADSAFTPDSFLRRTDEIKEKLCRFEFCVFGNLTGGRVRINLLPKDASEIDLMKNALEELKL